MKKILVFALTFVMLLSFCACTPDEEDVRGTQTDNSVNTETNENEAQTEEPIETQETVAPVTTPEASDEKFSFGTATGLTYENEFIGIGCTLPEGWTFYDDAQIKELNNITTDMAGEEYAKIVENANVIYDMMALGSNQADSVNVNLEKFDVLQLSTLDLNENYDKAIPTIKSSLENMGASNVSIEKGTLEIDGKEFVSLDIECEISGVKLYQKQFITKCNGYLATATIATYFENNTASILEGFYVL